LHFPRENFQNLHLPSRPVRFRETPSPDPRKIGPEVGTSFISVYCCFHEGDSHQLSVPTIDQKGRAKRLEKRGNNTAERKIKDWATIGASHERTRYFKAWWNGVRYRGNPSEALA
jgi:hypothetical protein